MGQQTDFDTTCDATAGENADETVVARVAETGVADLRQVAAVEPPPVAEDALRVPTAAQTANDVARADRALAEIRVRQNDEQLEAERERSAELARWHHDDPSRAGRRRRDRYRRRHRGRR
jgi:hypothetical protein